MKYIFIGLLLLLFTVSPVLAQQQRPTCGQLEDVVNHLAKTYGETLIAEMVSQGGHMVVIFANMETGTWSAAAVNPQKRACLIDAGDGFGIKQSYGETR